MGASDNRMQRDRETRLFCFLGELHAIPLVLSLQVEAITDKRMLGLVPPSN